MDIVHVAPAVGPPVLYPYGGAIQRRVLELARAQARRGHRVSIYSPGPEPWPGAGRAETARIRYLPRRLPPPLVHVEYARRVARDLSRTGAESDVVHFHSVPEGSLPGGSSSRAVRVLSYDYFRFRRGRLAPWGSVYRSLLRRFDLLLPCSRYCLGASAAHWRLPPEHLRVCHNGVDPSQFRPDPHARNVAREGLGIRGPAVLYVGRVCRQKGTDVLIEAVRRLRERIPSVRLVVAGPEEEFGRDSGVRLSAATESGWSLVPGGSSRWAASIEAIGGLYLGAVREDSLAAVYNLADVFVMPTLELEMFGMAAVEAQACGKPVVASDHGGLRETVPEECGGRFPAGDAAALADLLAPLLTDSDLREERAARARANAARFDWDRIADRLDALYEEAGFRGSGRR